jgi:LysR family cys regulon transcriptional activator
MCAWAWASASWPKWPCATIGRGPGLRPVGHLFGQSVARVAFKRGAYLRNFVYKFAELLSDRLSRDLIARAMTGHVNDYEL